MICATDLSTILPLIKAKPKFQFSQNCVQSLSEGEAKLRLFADKTGVIFSATVFCGLFNLFVFRTMLNFINTNFSYKACYCFVIKLYQNLSS